MQVDPRRDHSFRVPRPDLTLTIESPNACNNCHADQDAAWAQQSIAQWFPEGRWREPHYGEALAAGRHWTADRRARLQEVFYDESQPAIVRATALDLLAQQFDGGVLDAIEFALRAPQPLLQLAGLQSLDSADAPTRIRLGQRFLENDLRTLRINAARMLIAAAAGLSERRQADFNTAIAELGRSLEYNNDSAEGMLGVGLFAAQNGSDDAAESAYREAIERNPGLSAAYINLADLLRFTGREPEANAILQRAIEDEVTSDPGLYAALGLSHVRLGDTDSALAALARAAELAPDDPYHAYTYGLALAAVGGNEAAIEFFETATERAPGYAPILIALATMNRDAGNLDAAREYTQRLLAVSPGDPSAVALERELQLLR
jgi:tetratricopeptide (TPR) repeat protein